MYRELTDRELTGENLTNLKMQSWGLLHADWNGEARARGQNSQERAEYWTTPKSGKVLKGVGAGCVICIMSLNIRSGRAGGLEAALRDLRQGKVGAGILQETKLTNRVHTRYSSGYSVWATEVDIRHRGGIAVVC